MQDVIAVIGRQHGTLGGHAHDVAERMRLALEHAHRFGVAGHFHAAVRGYRDQRSVRCVAQQSLIELDLAAELRLPQAWRGVASTAMETKLMGVTAAAALIPLVMRAASSAIAAPIHPGGDWLSSAA